MLKKKILSALSLWSLCAAVICFGQLSNAGIEVGNGGFGVLVGEHLYLQDLFEAGIHQNPVLSPRSPHSADFQQAVKQALGGLAISSEVLDAVAVKLEDIAALDPSFADSIALALKSYSWRMVTISWDDPNDNGGVLNGVPVKFRQLALRSGKVVRMQSENWHHLDASNQVALIFHEMLYALLQDDPRQSQTPAQRSQQVRDLTAYLFSSDQQRLGLSGLSQAVGDAWFFGQGRFVRFNGDEIDTGMSVEIRWAHQFGFEVYSEAWNFQEDAATRSDRLCQRMLLGGDVKSIAWTMQKFAYKLNFVESKPDQDGNIHTGVRVEGELQQNTLPIGDVNAGSCSSKLEPILTQSQSFFGSAQ